MIHGAAALYGGAALLNFLEALIPGGERLSLLPGVVAVVVVALILVTGPRVSRRVLLVVGPAGALLISYALGTTHAPGDGAVLYMLPVLWTAYFYGVRGTALIVATVAVGHAVALLALSGMDGVDRWLDVVACTSAVAAVVRILVGRRDRLLEHLVTEARVDALTGLLNRRGFTQALALEAARAERDAASIAVVAFDIDRFKCINDRAGHDGGDHVLAWLGAVIAEEVRGVDIAARVGGEEFTVVLPRAGRDGAQAFAVRVLDRVRATSRRDLEDLPGSAPVTLSAGVAADRGPSDLDALLRTADIALYAAKRDGRDRVVVADVASAGAGV